ncbi:RES family NAD+ phosphorylase [Mycobacterium sp. 663a-19]|uniref:RES family NAD+ phosphorylase n=1 Tax=Mycobacterium sp. 663a-19 TaxID=2986148 RepID=UPI002D1F2BAF|nr:RES family NAD+ phosphorylase [Mycobacterium sp. 663a-19]MEB3982489.1 RES family NAD+ phosphorylase [Mycobacterium sp. 663a-19]
MVRQLSSPKRPLPAADHVWSWTPDPGADSWQWCRVYHRSGHTPDGITFRRYGPLYRFDHHYAADPPATDPDDRRILYVGEDLATSACEVFGATGVAAICPNYRVCIVAPTTQLAMFDLTGKGAAMAIGALPALADGNEKRSLTQEWARAIYEDQPAGPKIVGIRYRSGYNGGNALALWDCDRDIEVLRGAHELQDFRLNDPRILGRFQKEMTERRINVTTIPESACRICSRTP